MEPTRRLRIFAGPNGSGKTTIVNDLKTKYSFGEYINADDIEVLLNKERTLLLTKYQIATDTTAVQDFFKKSSLSPVKLDQPDIWKEFKIEKNRLLLSDTLKINSYIAADIAEFLRHCLLKAGLSFTYETVMSHKGKLDFMRLAKEQGYRIYLYYIATDDPDINISRVNIRVAQDGHAVKPEIISSRYYKSLENLKSAVLLSNRAYIFDNSGQVSKLLAEVTDGKEVSVIDTGMLPNWFITYLSNKVEI